MHFHIYAGDASVSRNNRDNIVQISHLMDEEISSKILSDFVWGRSMNQNLLTAYKILESFKDLKNIKYNLYLIIYI